MSARRRPTVRLRRSKAGYWVVICGGNGRVVWQTEMYKSKQAADEATELLFDLATTGFVAHDETAALSRRS